MRLGTCIALELAVAAGAVIGAWFAITRGAELAGAYVHSREAAAATSAYKSARPVEPLERSQLAPAPLAPVTVFGAPDAELLTPLAAARVTRIKLNRGGSSLSLRIDFASGARAAFKPMQIHPQSDPRREIAAYRIDRLLGIGHVPPARSAAFAIEDLIAAADPASRDHTAARLANEAIARDGKLCGELSWWIPEIKRVRLAGRYIDEADGEALWAAYLQAGAATPVELRPMLAQLATVIVFDVVVDNSDRWSGNNTQGSPDDRILYFMDNTLAFSQFTIGHAANLARLYRIQVFPRGLIGKLRALTAETIARAVGGDDLLGPLLTEAEIRAMLSRRDHLLEYVDRLIAELGEDAVLALP
ncbi:MAG: hypothetical protein E6J91_38120 [Deltaproteobacteria bacterium]|nr:MAG: hypothetical protein E6J91_38120 [Deltaproteobacteria bacterium]